MKHSILSKHYEIITNRPEPMVWEEYVETTLKRYQELLSNENNDEAVFQRFFEENPAMLPGAYGFFGESGHAPYNNALIAQPKLNGYMSRVPDFMWIATDSCTIYPVFIEIEKPSKKWFTKTTLQPTADFTQAQNQLTDWKLWFSDPTNQQAFLKFYEIDGEYMRSKAVVPYYVLIYGRREEFAGRHELNRKRKLLERENEIYMTFDRLSLNPKAKDVITCIKSNEGYVAKVVPSTFRLGPNFSQELSRIQFKDVAIMKSVIPDIRKEFLLSRLSYWDSFGKNPCGIISTSDYE